LVKTCFHHDAMTSGVEWGGGGRTSIRALVWMHLNTSHGQCPIETSKHQAKPAKSRVQMYVSWWGQCICVLWKWVHRACVYDLSRLVKN
jgi:hypothetical protein